MFQAIRDHLSKEIVKKTETLDTHKMMFKAEGKAEVTLCEEINFTEKRDPCEGFEDSIGVLQTDEGERTSIVEKTAHPKTQRPCQQAGFEGQGVGV